MIINSGISILIKVIDCLRTLKSCSTIKSILDSINIKENSNFIVIKALKNKSNPQSDNNYHMLDIIMKQYVKKEKILKKLKKSSKIELNKLMIGTQTRKIK